MPVSDYIHDVRKKIGHDLLMMLGAAAVIINDDGEVLLQQRSDNGLWGNPGGGIDPGETPAQAAIREAYEETGLEIEIERIVGIYGGQNMIFTYPHGDEVAVNSVTFQCKILSGTPHAHDDESLQVAWFKPDNLPETMMPVQRLRTLHAFERDTPYFYIPDKMPEPDTGEDYVQELRRKIGTDLLMMPGVAGVIQNEAGQILLGRRSDNGLWGLPGGAMNPGEEPVEALMREVMEECNVQVAIESLIGVYGGDEYYHTYPDGNQVYYIGY
ncbi:MAG: NUDIX domain-containing protein, partial [Aggregatilineales bacterium]